MEKDYNIRQLKDSFHCTGTICLRPRIKEKRL